MVLSFFTTTVLAETLSGVIYSNSELELAMGINSPISEVRVKEGDSIEIGQLLVVLEDKVQKLEERRRYIIWQDNSELTSLTERRKILESKMHVAQELYESARSISRDDLDLLRLELLQITGRIEQLNAQKLREEVEYQISQQEVEMRRLYAPSNGVVTKLSLKVGEWVKAGEPVLHLVDISNLFIRFNVSSKLITRLPVDLVLVVSVDNQFYKGRVSHVSPIADPASGLIEIKVSIDNSELKIRPGSKGTVELKNLL